MTHEDAADPDEPTTPRGRASGRSVVLGFLAFGVLFFGFMMLLALKIDPAVADRFHRGVAPTGR